MIHKLPSPLSGHVRIVFELPPCIWADQIAVVGDFNHWCKESTPMQQDHDGIWRAVVDLPQGGRFEFRYWVNGGWLTDHHADGYIANRYGSDNSIVLAMPAEQHLLVDRLCSKVRNGDRAPGYHPPRHAG
jgi:hypothetical protein